MLSRPLDAKPLFHSGVAPLRRRGFPIFLRPHARHGRAHRVIPRAARTHPSNPIAGVRIPAESQPRGAARGATGRSPQNPSGARGIVASAPPPRCGGRFARPRWTDVARRRWTSWDPTALRNDKFDRPVPVMPKPVMSNHPYLPVSSITYIYIRCSLLRIYEFSLIRAHPMNAHNPSSKLGPSPRGWALYFRATRWPITTTFVDTPTTS